MKRIVHYLVLAAVLIGTPLLCCWLGGYDELIEGARQFPPRTEDWGFHPEKLWNHRCPFSWWWFLSYVLISFLSLRPLVMRGFRSLKNAPRRFHMGVAPFPWWGWLGMVVMTAAWIITWNRFQWSSSPETTRLCQVLLSYFPVWMGYIITINALVKWRTGHCPMTDRPWHYALLFPASSLFWWFFEYLNRFVWNWYYLGISQITALEYAVYATLCFASVLPAVYATAEFLGSFRFFDDASYDSMSWRPDVRGPAVRIVLLLLSAAGLTGIVFWPQYTYVLLWFSPLMVFVLVQVCLKEPCILDRLKAGSWGLVFRFEIAALICGLCWETWNYYSLAKWVYAVPWVHAFQVWEMPLIGFMGYLPFGVECAAVTFWLLGAQAINKSESQKA